MLWHFSTRITQNSHGLRSTTTITTTARMFLLPTNIPKASFSAILSLDWFKLEANLVRLNVLVISWFNSLGDCCWLSRNSLYSREVKNSITHTLWSKGSTIQDKRGAAWGCREWPRGLSFFPCTVFLKLWNHINAGTPGTTLKEDTVCRKKGAGTGCSTTLKKSHFFEEYNRILV